MLVDDDDEPAPNLVWYVLKVQSSREDTIRDALERRVKIQGLQRFFGRIVVPTEKITEIRNNKKRIVERKTYPGYIMVEMELNEKTWFVVRETPGVGDFVGAHGTPTKMTEAEVNQMLGQETAKDRGCTPSPDRRRARRPGQDQGRPVRELRGDRRGSHRGARPGQGHADHLQPAHAGGPRILAGGADLTTTPGGRCPPDASSKGTKAAMAKVVTAKVKLQCPGGQATPAPPVGPALGQHGVNIGQFVMQFNERTKESKGTTIPVEITIYSDRSFEFITKSPPAAVLLKQTAGIASGSPEPHKTKVATVTAEQVRKIAETKFNDLNARDLDHACRIIAGTARSMGIDIKG